MTLWKDKSKCKYETAVHKTMRKLSITLGFANQAGGNNIAWHNYALCEKSAVVYWNINISVILCVKLYRLNSRMFYIN